MGKHHFFVGLLVSFSILLIAQVSEAARGITVQLKASVEKGAANAESVQLYSKSYALVIGNDAYTSGWPVLSGAINDAKLIAKALEKKGFQVTLKKNLKSKELKDTLEEFFIFKGVDPEARLFVWFAGHGHTMGGEGYLVPVDAPSPTEKPSQFRYLALSLRNFGTYVRQAQSKHAYSIFDACFAGTVFSTQRAIAPPAVTRATTQSVRQFLTSGDVNQTVSDNGMFRKMFIDAINGDVKADANNDSYLTASELGMFMTDKISNYTNNLQTPRYGKLRDPKYDRGDFIFLLPSAMEAGKKAEEKRLSEEKERRRVMREEMKEEFQDFFEGKKLEDAAARARDQLAQQQQNQRLRDELALERQRKGRFERPIKKKRVIVIPTF